MLFRWNCRRTMSTSLFYILQIRIQKASRYFQGLFSHRSDQYVNLKCSEVLFVFPAKILQVEKEGMPEEVRLITGTAGLFPPEQVAEAHVVSIENGYYSTPIGLDGWMLSGLISRSVW